MAALSGYPKKKVSRRLRLLRLAEKLGNIAEACRRSGFTRVQYYKFRRRYDVEGEAGLYDRSRAPHHVPGKKSDKLAEKVSALALEHPLWGCCRLERELKRQGHSIASATVQAILIQRGLGRREERCARLEKAVLDKTLPLPTKEQVAACERIHPRFRERGCSGMKPGQMLIQDMIRLGRFKGVGRVCAEVVIDAITLQTWVRVHLPDDDGVPLRFLRDKVIPDLHKRWLRVKVVSTPSCARYGRREHGGEYHEYVEETLKAWRCYPDPPTRRTNGYVEAFKREFLPNIKVLARKRRGWNMEQIQEEVEGWVEGYNREEKAG